MSASKDSMNIDSNNVFRGKEHTTTYSTYWLTLSIYIWFVEYTHGMSKSSGMSRYCMEKSMFQIQRADCRSSDRREAAGKVNHGYG